MATQKSRTIKEVTAEFGEAYKDAKVFNDDKARLQKEFFSLATQILSERTLARKTVQVPEGADADYLAQHYPGWRALSSLRPGSEEGTWEAVLEEDPALLGFNYINPEDRMVYARTTSQGSPMLDDERLQADDPELWEAISDYPEPWFGLVEGAIKHAFDGVSGALTEVHLDPVDLLYELNPSALAANFLRDRGIQRVVKPIEALTDEQLQAIQEYLVPAPVSVRLVPPRPAKQEELEEAGLA